MARIVHPTKGRFSPAAFLPSAGDEALIRLTERVLVIAMRDWESFARAGAPIRFAVNVPLSALRTLSFPALVRELRPKSEDWPGLVLEVTEDQVVRDIEEVHEIATQLRLYNVHLSIDYFGAGYPVLARLKDLSFSELKLDRSFVKNCATDPTNAAVCRSAIGIAHRFGSLAGAEGIEDEADLRALHRMGCDIGQGYLFSRPMPKADFINLLKSSGRRR